jgi:hypothetical protein
MANLKREITVLQNVNPDDLGIVDAAGLPEDIAEREREMESLAERLPSGDATNFFGPFGLSY